MSGVSVPHETEQQCIHLATGRKTSLFAAAFRDASDQIADAVSGKTILVSGAAGSIGLAAIIELLPFEPKRLVLVDTDENGLAETIRFVRSSGMVAASTEVMTIACDISSPLAGVIVEHFGHIDGVMNMAAAKHVRAERDVLSALRMAQVNVLGTLRLQRLVAGPEQRFFSVSTDKAANPASLMGATKRLMELSMFSADSLSNRTSCRFANVAFSQGSLLESWLRRIRMGQPVAVPSGISRYFVSPEEAGQFCLLSYVGETNSIFVPALDAGTDLIDLHDLLVAVLEQVGLVPDYEENEATAVQYSADRQRSGRQIVVVSEPDTAGEKALEIFVGEGEVAATTDWEHVQRIAIGRGDPSRVRIAEEQLRDWTDAPSKSLSVDDVVGIVRDAVPTYAPVRSDTSLDSRL
jgi:FlaA1/EpsC-like NDP-sugar epimerase